MAVNNVTVQDILDRCHILLQDNNLRWMDTELVGWINDAHKAIVLARPDAGMHTSTFTCVQGTRQTLLNANGLADLGSFTPVRLRSVIRNGTAGRAIRHEQQRVLDDQVPDWHSLAESQSCQFYIHDPANPLVFYLYPAPKSGHTVEVSYSAVPATKLTSGNLALEDCWAPVIVDYVLYRAYSKDAEYTANMERAAAHYKTFADALQANAQAQSSLAPVDDGRVTVNRA